MHWEIKHTTSEIRVQCLLWLGRKGFWKGLEKASMHQWRLWVPILKLVALGQTWFLSLLVFAVYCYKTPYPFQFVCRKVVSNYKIPIGKRKLKMPSGNWGSDKFWGSKEGAALRNTHENAQLFLPTHCFIAPFPQISSQNRFEKKHTTDQGNTWEGQEPCIVLHSSPFFNTTQVRPVIV